MEQLTAIGYSYLEKEHQDPIQPFQPVFGRILQLVTHLTHVMQLLGGGLAMRICGLQPLDWLNFWETAQVELSPSDEKNS